MNATEAAHLRLVEYKPLELRPEGLPYAVGEALHADYGDRVDVEFPSPVTKGLWRLTSQGWVGYVPLPEGRLLELAPRVPVQNVFGMLEYAYGLKSFHVLEGHVRCDTLADFYERLANILARRVLDRIRRGLYRTYVDATDDLVYVRGRIDLAATLRRAWQPELSCHYQEHTPDVDENALLTWTLDRIVRSGLCRSQWRGAIRTAHRRLLQHTTLRPFSARDCVGRDYDRLCSDYSSLHALCRFFLESSGPSRRIGDREMVPFLVSMPHLFEAFVAEWLAGRLAPHYRVKHSRSLRLGQAGEVSFRLDVLVSDRDGTPRIVIDTKYKLDETPKSADLAQVVAYAKAVGCTEAVLLYPRPLASAFEARVGDVHARSIGFDLAGELDTAGEQLLSALIL